MIYTTTPLTLHILHNFSSSLTTIHGDNLFLKDLNKRLIEINEYLKSILLSIKRMILISCLPADQMTTNDTYFKLYELIRPTLTEKRTWVLNERNSPTGDKFFYGFLAWRPLMAASYLIHDNFHKLKDSRQMKSDNLQRIRR